MRNIFFIPIIIILFSCQANKHDLDGHWHLIETSEAQLFPMADVPPFEIFTLDINGENGECNANSLFQVKSILTVNVKYSQIAIESVCHPPLILNYNRVGDTLVLTSERGNKEYMAFKVDLNCCNYRNNHFLDGAHKELYLPFLRDSVLTTVRLNWKSSNYILYESNRRENLWGTELFQIKCDNRLVQVKDLKTWYADYISRTCNKIQIFSDQRQSQADIKRLIIELEKIPCDSIFFAAIDDGYDAKIRDIKWIELKDLSGLISENERKDLDTLDIENSYGKKSEDWLFQLITNANVEHIR